MCPFYCKFSFIAFIAVDGYIEAGATRIAASDGLFDFPIIWYIKQPHLPPLPPPPPPTHLKLINLLLPIPQLPQHTPQLSLILWTLLHATNRLIHPRRPTHKNLHILHFRFGQDLLEEVIIDVPRSPLGPIIGGLVEHVESAETLGVGVFEVLEFVFEEDVGFGEVAVDEGDFGFVGGVGEDGAAELVHSVFFWGVSILVVVERGGEGRGGIVRGYACAAGDETDVVVLVGRPGVFGDGTFEFETLRWFHVVEVGRHGAVGVFLDHEVDVASCICQTLVRR